ncbi:MAG: VIT domain-containing protein, partial [Planctomycetaceae bacterium]
MSQLFSRRGLARWLVLACLAVGAAVSPHVAQAAGLLIADGGLGGVLEIRQHEVSVVINNGIAVTEVRQVFHNTEQRAVEALYTFPVPAGASVSNFSMIINGQEMVGEVVEKQRARQIYNSYKQVRRDPGLLEQVDYKTFELRVFPIPANADQHIKVTYCQQLDFDHDNATYVYPLATVTRKGIDQKARGKFSLTLDVKSEIPITKLSSPSHADDFVVSSPNPNY